MLAEVDSLPSSQGEPASGDGDLQTAADQGRLHVCRHVIRPFDRVNVVQGFGGDMIQGQLHVDSDIRIRVFIDAQTGRRVLQETMQRPDLDFPQLWQRLQDFFRDEMAASSDRRKLDSGLIELHGEAASRSLGIFNAS